MKPILFILAVLISAITMSQSPKSKTCIIITKTTPYCGGANPSEQIIEETKKKKIPLGEKFYIIKGYKNNTNRKIIASFVINSSGKSFSMLKPGCYSILDDFGYNKIMADTSIYDLECLIKLWEIPLFTFQVKKKKNVPFLFNISEPCPYNKPCYKEKLMLPM